MTTQRTDLMISFNSIKYHLKGERGGRHVPLFSTQPKNTQESSQKNKLQQWDTYGISYSCFYDVQQ